jgi:hypothetical protein
MRTTRLLDSDLISNRWNASVARRVLARWRRSDETLTGLRAQARRKRAAAELVAEEARR